MEGRDIRQQRGYYVVKANDLCQKARYNMTVQQQKLILYAISKIQPTDTKDTLYELSIKDVCEVMGIEYDTGGVYYRTIKNDLLKLTTRVWVQFPDRSEGTFSWLSDAYIIPLSGTVQFRFHEKAAPYLFDLRERYTQYQLYEVLTLKSKYSIRLYELLRSYLTRNDVQSQKDKEVCFELEELKELISSPKYDKYNDFDRFILRKAVAEINATSDQIRVEYGANKRGKKVTSVYFIITYPTMGQQYLAHEERRGRLRIR